MEFDSPQHEEEWNSVLRELEKRVNKQVSFFSGMSNSLLDKLMQETCSTRYKGVFNEEDIPTKLYCEDDFMIVVNTMKHFVLVNVVPSCITYIDSGGLPPYKQSPLNQFLVKCAMGDLIRRKKTKRLLINTKEIQVSESTYCGLYCVLFAMYMEYDTLDKMTYHKKASIDNDDICLDALLDAVNKVL